MVNKQHQWEADWVCPHCNMARGIAGGPDPCLGYLPGVEYACCGHGGTGYNGNVDGYIKFTNGVVIRWSKLTESPLENGTHRPW